MNPDTSIQDRQRSFLEKFLEKSPEENLLHRLILTNAIEALTNQATDETVNQSIDHHITPLHVATMMDNQTAAEILITAGNCAINARDDRCATPLFHAAIAGNRVFIQYLLDLKADPDCYPGVNYNQLLKLSYPDSDPLSPHFHYDDGRQVTERNGEDFKRLTGATYIEENYVHPLTWHDRWVNFYNPLLIQPTILKSQEQLLDLYERFRSESRQLTVMKHDPQIGYYLCASGLIKKGTIVEEYLAEISDVHLPNLHHHRKKHDSEEDKFIFHDRGDKEYTFEGFYAGSVERERKNSFSRRNLASQINCSFPNLLSYKIYNVEGMLERVIFIANTKIKKGEPLTFDYHSPVKLGCYVEMRLKEMERFFKSKTLETLKTYLPRTSYPDDLTERLNRLGEESKLTYLLTTPTAMLALISKNIMSIDTIDVLFREFHGIELDEVKMIKHYKKTYQGCFLLELKKLVENKPLWKKHKVQLFKMLGKTTLLDIYKKIKSINTSSSREFIEGI